MTDKNARIIAKRTKEAGKTYGFQKDHNPRIPADYWFQNPVEGLLIFIVFYTQACRWAKCLGCNLPSQVSQEHVCYKDILKQVDFIFHNVLSDRQKKDLRKIIVSNNGSVLDERISHHKPHRRFPLGKVSAPAHRVSYAAPVSHGQALSGLGSTRPDHNNAAFTVRSLSLSASRADMSVGA